MAQIIPFKTAAAGTVLFLWWERIISFEWIAPLAKGFVQIVAALLVVSPSSLDIIPASFTPYEQKELTDVAKLLPFSTAETKAVYEPALKLWVLARGSVDSESYVDAQGRAVNRNCTFIYAARGVEKNGYLEKPVPYVAGYLVWREAARYCSMEQKKKLSTGPGPGSGGLY